MGMELKFGVMALVMKEIGNIIVLMVKEHFGIFMEMCIQVIGSMIKLKAKGFINMQMELNMKVNGWMIYRMDKVQKIGLMVASL